MAEKIHARELRIGNIYKASDLGHAAITAHDIVLAERGIEFEPMPLSERWIKDFGFKERGRFHHYRIHFRIGLNPVGLACELWLDGQYWAMVEYVHQLQNLYFDLSREELNFHPTSHLNQ